MKKKKLYCKVGLYCSLGEKLYCDNRFCIAIIGIVLQPRQLGWAGSVLQYTGLYCREEGSVVLQDCIARGLAGDNLYRNTVYCIVAGRAAEGKVVSQYNLEYCGRRQGCLCRKTGSCVAIRR